MDFNIIENMNENDILSLYENDIVNGEINLLADCACKTAWFREGSNVCQRQAVIGTKCNSSAYCIPVMLNSNACKNSSSLTDSTCRSLCQSVGLSTWEYRPNNDYCSSVQLYCVYVDKNGRA